MRFFINLFLILVLLFVSLVGAANISIMVTIISLIICIILLFIILYTTHGYSTNLFIEENKTKESATNSIHFLISIARKSIKIVSGRLRDDVYLLEVINKLTKAIENNVKIQIILADPKAELRDKNLKNWLKEGKIEIKKLQKEKTPHFIIVDEHHIRLEKVHRSGTSKREADIRYSVPWLASQYSKKFDTLLKSANDVAY